MMSSAGHRHCLSLLITFVLPAVCTAAIDTTDPRISSLDCTLHSHHEGETLVVPSRSDVKSVAVTGVGGGWARATRSLLKNREYRGDSSRDSAAMSADNFGRNLGENLGENLGGNLEENLGENLGKNLGENLSCMSDGA